MKNPKRNDKLIIVIGVLSVLVLINIVVSFRDSGIKDVTGSVVQETADSGNENYNDLVTEISRLRSENERLIVEKNALSEKIKDLEAEIKAFEQEKEAEEETCPLTCGVDELCSPVNKIDGSVEWQCVDDPAKFV